jgi:competence protein ComEA
MTAMAVVKLLVTAKPLIEMILDRIRPARKEGKININSAGIIELESLPGVGRVLSQRIIAYRGEHGLFRTIEGVKKVQGIGDVLFGQVKELIKV